ncbi:MAG: hypothetical protein AUG51_03730 [Acidobacteria bacterium 13_1_20CM_3_53_8]|nr:MAG: hypothetical protein AUG51_03730 [Acidobacteria bacterium 13_1_20CM_3_53_8]
MILIRDVISDREGYSVHASQTVLEAAQFMAARNIGAVCVVDDDGQLQCVLSERDILKKVVAENLNPADVKVSAIANEPRAIIRCDERPHDAIMRMEQIGSRHLPVFDEDRWVGMLSIRDLLRVEVGEQGDELKLLHDYISQ